MRRSAKSDFEPRWSAGYREFRHGEIYIGSTAHNIKSRITLAGRNSAPIFRGEKRKSLINEVMDVLRDWRLSPFENEGSVRAGMRSALCLKGYGWNRSDRQVEDIVAQALRLMGAERPSFEQGQPAYSNGTDFCHWCFCPIDEEDRSRRRRFCTPECAQIGLQYMTRKTTHHYGAVLRSAIRMIDREKAEPQECGYCGDMFKSDRSNQRFCSSRCAGLHRAGDAVYTDRSCELCRATFHPISQSQRYCSQSCSMRARLKAEAESLAGVRLSCECCGEQFRPTRKNAIYCSTRCYKTAGQRAYAERNKVALASIECRYCGDVFQPKTRGAMYCSRRCTGDAHLVAQGRIPRVLTRRAFDHFIAMPIEANRRNTLTPAKFDWILMERGLRITREVRLAA